MGKGSEVRALVVGYGGIGTHMLKILKAYPWFSVAGVVDLRPEALARAKADHGLQDNAVFTDLDTALKRGHVDVALINTPSELHFVQTKAVLEAGVHPLVAKPVANRYEDAVALVELAEARGLKLSVGQQIRYNRHFLAVRRFLESGRIGSVESVFLFNAKPRPQALNLARMDQPALYENACHHFDALMALFPQEQAKWISCDGFRPSWSPYAGPCMVNALIRFSGGLHVLYHGGFSSQADCYELRLEGTKGALRCRGVHMSVDTMQYEWAERGGKWTSVQIDEGIPARDPFHPFFDLWHEYLNGGPEPPFSGRNNLKVFALLCAGIDSVNSEQPVVVAGNPRFASAFAAPVESPMEK